MKYKLALLIGGIMFFQACKQNPSKEMVINTLEFDLEFLAHDSLMGRETGTKGEEMAANFIAKRMKEIGLTPKGDNSDYYQNFTKKTKENPHSNVAKGTEINGKNVLGYLDNGKSYTIVIGAHYDHLGMGGEGSLYDGGRAVHNGADDNASGVAAMLSMAEYLKANPNENNYLFIAFSGEEKGLWGSNYFIKNPTIDSKAINYMINMDMVGRLDSNRRLAIHGVGTSSKFKETVESIKSPVFKIKLDSSGVGPSDHTSFYNDSIPVLHFFTGQHEHYHKPTDDVELINFEGLYDVRTFILEVINKLDKTGKQDFYKTKEKKNKSRSFKITLGIMPDYLYDGAGLKIDGVTVDRPAFNAGILKGDVVIKLGDKEIPNMNAYMDFISENEEGTKVDAIVLRKGEEVTLSVTFD